MCLWSLVTFLKLSSGLLLGEQTFCGSSISSCLFTLNGNFCGTFITYFLLCSTIVPSSFIALQKLGLLASPRTTEGVLGPFFFSSIKHDLPHLKFSDSLHLYQNFLTFLSFKKLSFIFKIFICQKEIFSDRCYFSDFPSMQ